MQDDDRRATPAKFGETEAELGLRPSLPGRPSLAGRLANLLEQRPGVHSLAATGLFVIAVFCTLYAARDVFIPLALASMLYFLLRPAVRKLVALRIPKTAASALVLGSVFTVFVALSVEVSEPASVWAARLPEALRTLENRVRPLRQPIERASEFAERVERATQVKEKPVTQVAVHDRDFVDSALVFAREMAAQALVLLIALYFMLIYGDRLLERLLRFLPELHDRTITAGVLNQIEHRMSQYMRTITFINLGLGTAATLTLAALGVPNPWLWALIGALANYVPYLGALTTMCLLAIVSFVTYEHPWRAVLPPLAYLVLTTIEGNFITPMILGRAFRVSPLVIFVWLVFWTWLWGVAGAVVAVPLLMLIKITCEQSEDLVWFSELIEK